MNQIEKLNNMYSWKVENDFDFFEVINEETNIDWLQNWLYEEFKDYASSENITNEQVQEWANEKGSDVAWFNRKYN